MVLGFVTPEASTRAEGNTGQTSAKGDGVAEGTEDGTTPRSRRLEQAAIGRKRKSGAFREAKARDGGVAMTAVIGITGTNGGGSGGAE
jgi:hypothetical protein